MRCGGPSVRLRAGGVRRRRSARHCPTLRISTLRNAMICAQGILHALLEAHATLRGTLPRGTEYSFSVPLSACTYSLRWPLETSPNFTVPSISLMTAVSCGLRASNNSTMRLAGFEQLDHARQTTGDVFRLGGFARDLGQHVSRENRVAVLHHEVSAGRHEVALAAFALHHDRRLALLVGRVGHNVPRQSGNLVHFFVQRDAFLQVLELRRAANFGKDGESVRIPLHHHLALLHLIPVVDFELGAVNHRVAFALAIFLVHDRNRTLAVHHHQISGLGLHGLQCNESHGTVVLGIEARLLGHSRSRAADVERTHGELRSGFADRLRGNHSGRFAEFNQAARGQVAAVAHDADAALRLASEHRTNLYPLDSGGLNGYRELFGNLVVDVEDPVAVVVFDLLERDAAHNAVAQRLDNFTGFDDSLDVNAVHRTAVVLADDDVLRHIDEPASEVAGIRRLERRIGQALAGAVRRDEVFQHRQPLAEVRRDG